MRTVGQLKWTRVFVSLRVSFLKFVQVLSFYLPMRSSSLSFIFILIIR
jgi:hypothetical protein